MAHEKVQRCCQVSSSLVRRLLHPDQQLLYRAGQLHHTLSALKVSERQAQGVTIDLINLGLGRNRKLADEAPGAVGVTGQCLLGTRHPATERPLDPCITSHHLTRKLTTIALDVSALHMASRGGM